MAEYAPSAHSGIGWIKVANSIGARTGSIASPKWKISYCIVCSSDIGLLIRACWEFLFNIGLGRAFRLARDPSVGDV